MHLAVSSRPVPPQALRDILEGGLDLGDGWLGHLEDLESEEFLHRLALVSRQSARSIGGVHY